MSNELVWAIKNGDLDEVSKIVEHKGICINDEINGRPPIVYAADYGQIAVLEYLIRKGSDVNASDKHGITALLSAIWEGHVDAVRVLLAHGAIKNNKTPNGDSYIEAAEKEEIRELLRS